jgi:uncharacterized protein
VIAGVATRALAVSAARAGYRVTAVDAFGDVDLRAVAEVVSLRRKGGTGFSARAAALAARGVRADLAGYTSNFENHPEAVALLARGRHLLGNRPSVLEQIRNPLILMRALRHRGFAVPLVRSSPPSSPSPQGWLLKPRRSGGGHGITIWRGHPVPRSWYLQERIAGVAGSITFVADGHRAVPLGISRQLIGEEAFGSQGFRYCGSLLSGSGRALFDRGEQVVERARDLAGALAEEFGLVGLNGLDFIARDGVPYPIEVNPRYSASMELIERASGISLFEAHAESCAGTLLEPPALAASIHGKAVVFARRAVTVGDTAGWAAQGIADIPHPGERIGRGHPICTVFAEGVDLTHCRRTLERRAAPIYRGVEESVRGAA